MTAKLQLDKILSKHTYVQSEAECGSCSTNVVYIASVAGGFALLRLASLSVIGTNHNNG